LGELFGFGRTQNRQQQKIRNEPNILLTTDISFKDSIYGCKKELSFDRKIACRACDGHCVLIDSEKACKKCHGTGQTVSRNGNSIITQTCSSCRGARHTIPCTSCGAVGYSVNTTSVSVSIPPGVINNNVLKLQGMGNFCGIRNLFGGAAMQAHTDTLLTIKVEPNDKFKIEGNDIVCVENITLLDAIKGKTIPVATLDGDEQITIKPLSKNKDEIVLSRKGLGRVGNQRIVLNIDYPENINDIINILEKKDASSTDMR
jgi:molecular chaperone DnaJ